MKLSRNVLVGSLATVGMVLGAVAPAVTAQAAKTSATVDPSTNEVNGNTVENGKYATTDTDSLADGGLAIAYDNGTDNTVGEASAQSNANVKVISGLLVLNAVPDFGFGSAAMGSTVNLANNNYDNKATDSTGSDAVKITETRSGQPGFSLGATIGDFTGSDGSKGEGFVLNLKPTALTDADGNNVGATSEIRTNNVELAAPKGDADATNIVDVAKGSYNAGQINASFKPSDKNVTLKLGTGTGTDAAKNAKVTSYNANITWTLTAKPTVTTAA